MREAQRREMEQREWENRQREKELAEQAQRKREESDRRWAEEQVMHYCKPWCKHENTNCNKYGH